MRIIICAALLVLFCVGNGVAESPRQKIPPESIDTKDASSKKQYGTDESPFVVKTIHPPKSPEETKNDADERNDRKALNKFTLWLAIIGVFQFFILAFQVYFLSKTLRATEKAANAAKESASHIAKVERAYVFVSATMGDKKLLNGEFVHHDAVCDLVYLSMSAVIKNHGKTPAILSKFYGGWKVVSNAPTRANVDAMKEDSIPTGIILSADREPYIITVGDPAQNERFHVTLTQWQEIIRREKTFFLYGRVEYKDILGDDRNTGFCWQYCPGDETTSFTIADSDLNYCDENNNSA